MTKGIKPTYALGKHRGLQCSDVLTAVMRNIEQYLIETKGLCEDEKHLLTEFSIPQIKEVIARLKK